MAAGRKITFQLPESLENLSQDDASSVDLVVAGTGVFGQQHRALLESTDAQAAGRVQEFTARYPRCGSPYPCEYTSESMADAVVDKMRKIQRSLSSIFNTGRQTNNRIPSDEGDESLQRYKQSLGLGGGKDLSDPNDPRVCIIQSLTMESPGRAPVVIDLTAPGSVENLKKNPFKIKEGATFTMSAQFKVQHEILSGLHYVQVIKRKGIRIPGGKSDEMIVRNPDFAEREAELTESLQGSYAPNTDKQPIYTKKCMFSLLILCPSHHIGQNKPTTPPANTVSNNAVLVQEETAPSGWAVRDKYSVSSSFVDDDKKTHLQFDWAFEIDKDW